MVGKHNRNRRQIAGEHWTKLIRHTMEEPAYSALSTAAQALYPWLKLEWRGPDANNNGKIRLSVRQAATRIGVIPDTAAEAFRDLQRKGFIVQTEAACLGIAGAARSPAYEITELKMPGTEGDGRKLYRDWQPEKDFPVPTSSPNNPGGSNGRKSKPCHGKHDVAVMKTMTNRGEPVMKTMTACHENHDEQAPLAGENVMKSMTSLSYHTSTPASGPTQPAAHTGRQASRARAKADKRSAFKGLLHDTAAALSLKTEGGSDAA